MDKRRAWVIPAIVGVTLLASYYTALGGLSGIAREPLVSAILAGMLLIIGGPLLWLSYRRNRRDPLIAPVEPTLADVFGPIALDRAPIVFVGSRWKVAGWIVYLCMVFGVLLDMGLHQHGLCRTVSLTTMLPVALWGLATLLLRLARPERLTVAREGLTHHGLWRTRRWNWDEIRDVQLIKRTVPLIGWFLKRRPVAAIRFRRYQPPDQTRGPSAVGLRSIFRTSGYDIASTLEAAREEWSTPAGAGFIPVPRRWRNYLPTAAVVVLTAAWLWILIANPCGR